MESHPDIALFAPLEEAFCQELSRLAPVRREISGRDLTTYCIGGPVAILCEPDTEEQLAAVVRFLRAQGVPWRVLGAGSNVLLSDSGLHSVVLRLGKGFRTSRVTAESEHTVTVEAGAAASVMTLSRTFSEQGLSGLEFAAGIPASVGGAVVMNAGAHGSEMAAVLEEITVLREGQLERIAARTLPFRYRHSGLDPAAIVVGASFTLQRGNQQEVIQRRAECLAERKARQPLTSPSAGSVFRNPSAESPAGRLIESCGLKGTVEGGALISPLHANWIINPSRAASARDVRSLMARCMETVESQTGVRLQPEVIYWE